MALELTETEEGFYDLMRESALGRRWLRWHKENPDFYHLFERFTFEAVNRGHKRLSGWLIANRVRWETSVVTKGDDYKISNDFIALYARLFMVRHSRYEGFFRTKRMKRLVRDIMPKEDAV